MIVTTKSGVEFTIIAPGGFAILGALQMAAYFTQRGLVITSACDGIHSGPNDPHRRGEAYDVRSHNLEDEKNKVLENIMLFLPAERFFGFIEDEGTDNEHIHVQVKKGTSYPGGPVVRIPIPEGGKQNLESKFLESQGESERG